MVRIGKILVLVLALGAVFTFQYGSAQTAPDLRVGEPFAVSDLPSFAADQLVVKFKPAASQTAIDALKGEQGANEMRRSKLGGFVTLRLPEGSDVLAKAEIFDKNPLVEYAHPNYFAHASFVPNDTFYNFQWHFDDDNTNNPGGATVNPFGGTNGGGIGMEAAWDISTGNSSVIVAVLDSGAAYETFSDSNDAGCYNINGVLKACKVRGKAINEYFLASDLASTTFNILLGSDFVNSDDHPNDDRNHGTHVTGTIAQSTNNSNSSVAGIAFDTTIMPMKVLDGSGSGLFDVIADAIMIATDEGADVINMSLGSSFDAQVLEDAVAYAFNNGVVVVAACGNSSASADCDFPAAYNSSVIAVGATQYDETLAPYSSSGPSVDVVAPGGNNGADQNEDGFADGVLQQTFTQNDPSDFAFFFFQGTSMATPHVAALAALILAVDNSLTPTQVRNVIESTAEEKGVAGRDNTFGHGLIDAKAALESLSGVSITLTTDSSVAFEILPLDATEDTTASGIDDVQTVSVVVGPANLDVRSTVFSDGNGNTWSLGASGGANQVKWEFSPDGTTWTTFENAGELLNLANDVAETITQDLYLRITMPSSSSSSDEHSSTITIVATTP